MNLKIELEKIFESPDNTYLLEAAVETFLDNYKNIFLKKGIYFKLMQSVGGEGEGEIYFSVYSFVKDNEIEFIKFDSTYTSYMGADFNEWFFVKPEAQVSIEYERVK